MKILLAVDGSEFTKRMLAYLVTHDTVLGNSSSNSFTVLTVQPTMPPRVRAALGKSVVEQYQHDEAERVLAPVSRFLQRHDIEARSTWKAGPVGEQIARFAELGKFDLLVMGSRGHGALGNLVMGSVATKVLASCKVPVLLVR